ncbi:MAG: exodeoxyribonuclease III [Thiotrichaceae bacterium]
MLKIATWNVNSLRVRLPQVLEWLQQQQPDIVALQETKLVDAAFPHAAFTEMGYHAIFTGQKAYNGVALLSRTAGQDVRPSLPTLNDEQQRFLATTYTFQNKALHIVNVYVPNGTEVGCDRYEYKLRWLASLRSYLQEALQQFPELIVLGDFNIAPTDADVLNPTDWINSVLVSEPERRALQHLFDLGLFDAFRLFSQPEFSFSWWNYQAASFRRNDGARIDLILLSNSLKHLALACDIDRVARGQPRPSDHAPVMLKLRDVFGET